MVVYRKKKENCYIKCKECKKYSVQKNMTWLHTSIGTSWAEGIYTSADTHA